jgi:DUF971 family protein
MEAGARPRPRQIGFAIRPRMADDPAHPAFRMQTPANIQMIGDEIAIAWSDGAESYIRQDLLRRASPSAETQGERDVFGNQYGGAGGVDYSGVRVLGWERIGNYALRFVFSDRHTTGLYTYDYLRRLGALNPP